MLLPPPKKKGCNCKNYVNLTSSLWSSFSLVFIPGMVVWSIIVEFNCISPNPKKKMEDITWSYVKFTSFLAVRMLCGLSLQRLIAGVLSFASQWWFFYLWDITFTLKYKKNITLLSLLVGVPVFVSQQCCFTQYISFSVKYKRNVTLTKLPSILYTRDD